VARDALLLHGFTGTPRDLASLNATLSARGLRVEAPTLPGHDAPPRELGRTRWPDWERAASAALDRLGPRVAVAGLSMGALLAIRLAALRPERVAALALISTPLRFGAHVHVAAALGWLIPTLPKGPVDSSDPAERTVGAYARWPLRALSSVLDLAREARACAARVRAPALIVHALHDHVASPACADELQRILGGPVTRRTLLRSYHLVTRDVERDEAARAVADYFEEHAS
jgi:carboxylesterase